MGAENRAEVRVTFFKVIPLMLIAGAVILGLKYFIARYLGYRIPSFIYGVIAIVAVVAISNKYIRRRAQLER